MTGDVLDTLYTVAGVIFSVGMSLTVSPKTDGVANETIKKSIRYCKPPVTPVLHKSDF